MIAVDLIAAARPNFMKIAPLWHALRANPEFTPRLVHTGQHYAANMSDAIFTDLRLGQPDLHLGVGSGTHAEQTARVMTAYEAIAIANRPDWLIVVGDVNSTLACALVAAKLRIPLVHLEAGLRSGDRDMPEEINRLVTDVVSDVLWTPSPDGDANLLAEGCRADRITRVGNIMLDSFELARPAIEAAASAIGLDRQRRPYAVVTLHRPSNVDTDDALARCTSALLEVQKRVDVVFPAHPRTAKRLAMTGWDRKLVDAGVSLLEPQSYIRFMSLVLNASAVITDSGGIQEETTYLGIPCLTLRENTERPITVTEGTNRLAKPHEVAAMLDAALDDDPRTARRPDLWDGRTAGRCIDDLQRRNVAR